MDSYDYLRNRLALAEEHVRRAEAIVANQAQIVANMKRRGADTADAERLLDTFRRSLLAFEIDRDRLKASLQFR